MIAVSAPRGRGRALPSCGRALPPRRSGVSGVSSPRACVGTRRRLRTAPRSRTRQASGRRAWGLARDLRWLASARLQVQIRGKPRPSALSIHPTVARDAGLPHVMGSDVQHSGGRKRGMRGVGIAACRRQSLGRHRGQHGLENRMPKPKSWSTPK